MVSGKAGKGEMSVNGGGGMDEVRVRAGLKRELICENTHEGPCEPPYVRGWRSR